VVHPYPYLKTNALESFGAGAVESSIIESNKPNRQEFGYDPR
jgi:hypothetical protein